MAMRITHVYKDCYPPTHGGIEQHIHTLVHQTRDRLDPEVLVSGRRPGRWSDDGIPVQAVGCLGRLQGAPISPCLPFRLRVRRADLFHFHMPNPTGELAYLLSGSRVPAVATYHADVVRQARLMRLYRPFLERFLRRARRIIVSSPNLAATAEVLKPHRDRCRIVPYGIDVQRFEPTPRIREQAEALRRAWGPRIVLFAGVFRYYKGLEFLLRAMARVDGALLLAGAGPEEARLRALAAELGIERRVGWLSLLAGDDYVAALHACDVFVLPSIYRSEAFGIVQLEAAACGKPLVSTALGTGTDYANLHGVTGLVVPPRDPDALADALERLLDDPDYRRELGERGRARVRAEFTKERMAEAILHVYQEALNGELARSPAAASARLAGGRN